MKFIKAKLIILYCISFCITKDLIAQKLKGPSDQLTGEVVNTLKLAGENAAELRKYAGTYSSEKDSLKKKAALFLLSQMGEDKFSYTGDIITKYDTILAEFAVLREQGVLEGDPPVITSTWTELNNSEGPLNTEELEKDYDYKTVSASFLRANEDAAFVSWNQAPGFISKDFSTFCEYALPYRVGNEKLETYRERYYQRYKPLIDSSRTPEELISRFNQELFFNQAYRSSLTLWSHPLDFSISQMELGHRGACRQLTVYCALTMRACGLPTAIDYSVWGSRSGGHSWNVLMLDSNKTLPFEAFAGKRIKFDYKPAKIFRKKFSAAPVTIDKDLLYEIPADLITPYDEDVTDQYGNAYNIEVPITKKNSGFENRHLAVICTFDNSDWRAVHYGPIKDGKMYFDKMGPDVVYMAAHFDGGFIIPASDPFILKANGELQYCNPDSNKKINVKLTRKYPMSKRVRIFALSMRGMTFETADTISFDNAVKYFSVFDLPFSFMDSAVSMNRPYRYIRFKAPKERFANLAEVEFYGKLEGTNEEVKLNGTIIGEQEDDPGNIHPYQHAMDGNLETWFEKKDSAIGWVGLDLGAGNRFMVTRVRFCPRSDTNFILVGDDYELKYWDDEWKSFDVKKATEQSVPFVDVPAGALLLLHNQSRGREERIFTFENGKQVWW